MPTIGIPPQFAGQNNFSNIKMNPGSIDTKSADDLKAEIIKNANGGAPAANPLYKENNNKMGKDEFLKLLTYQLQNQDPTKPVEQHKMAGELAQFSQLEQLSNIHSLLQKRENNTIYENKFYAASFLGKKILTSGANIDYKGEGTKAKLNFSLENGAKSALIRIFDKSGNMVEQIEKEKLPQGPQTLVWEGTTLDGAGAGKGQFTFEVKSWDENMQPIRATTKVAGTVNGVSFDNGEVILDVNGSKVSLREVDSFQMPERPDPTLDPLPAPNPVALGNNMADPAIKQE